MPVPTAYITVGVVLQPLQLLQFDILKISFLLYGIYYETAAGFATNKKETKFCLFGLFLICQVKNKYKNYVT